MKLCPSGVQREVFEQWESTPKVQLRETVQWILCCVTKYRVRECRGRERAQMAVRKQEKKQAERPFECVRGRR